MATFQSICDESLAQTINEAKHKVVYVAPGVGLATTKALQRAMENESVSLTIIIDSDEEACRIGYGDHEALSLLHESAKSQRFPLRRQQGLRIGMIVSDDQLTIWSPTARLVEAERESEQPNAIVLKGAVVESIETAVGADNSQVLPGNAQIGQHELLPQELHETVDRLKANPPAPFDLAQKTRVFSTRFQFVECEVRGVEWTGRKMKLSSLLLNADLPEVIQDLLETQVRPFQRLADMKFDIPLMHDGEPAYRKDLTPIMIGAKQSDIAHDWTNIRDNYLRHVKGFGWLIRKDQLREFKEKVSAHEECLSIWVKAFREHAEQVEEELISSIVSVISSRFRHSVNPDLTPKIDFRIKVKNGLRRMRVIEPMIRIVQKDVSWESSRDGEFTAALKKSFLEEELSGWFEEFIAAKEQLPSTE